MAEIVVITGLSGAGRSGAAAVLEDIGWYVVDNLPTSLVPTIVELASKPVGGIDRLALVSGRNHDDLLPHVAQLRGDGHHVVNPAPRELPGMGPHLGYGHAVGKEIQGLKGQAHTPTGLPRRGEAGRTFRFHPNHLHLGAEVFHVGGDARQQSAAPHGDKNGI